MKNDEPLWTIDELSDQVATALARGYGGPPNGRVRDVPDRRTIRYYTTLGLIDRPASLRGRTALYGRRHLLQLVAIKQLQARGQSLAEVQRALAGQTDQALAAAAGLDGADPAGGGDPAARPPEWHAHPAPDPTGPASRGAPATRTRSARQFWRQEAAQHGPEGSEIVVQASRLHPESGRRDACTTTQIRPQAIQGILLVDGVTLLLASSRPLDGPDLEAIRAAAAPLIDTLTERQLISYPEEGESP
jgi:DNA-binding transcriptional MerR regulator